MRLTKKGKVAIALLGGVVAGYLVMLSATLDVTYFTGEHGEMLDLNVTTGIIALFAAAGLWMFMNMRPDPLKIRFESGDKVIVLKMDDIHDERDRRVLNSDMEVYSGREATIRCSLPYCKFYYIDLDGGKYVWPEGAFKPSNL